MYKDKIARGISSASSHYRDDSGFFRITDSKNNITVKGKYSGILGTSSSRIEELETKNSNIIKDRLQNHVEQRFLLFLLKFFFHFFDLYLFHLFS